MFSLHILFAAAGALFLFATGIVVVRRRRRRQRLAQTINQQFTQSSGFTAPDTPRSQFSRPIKVIVTRKPDGEFGLGFYGCASATAAAQQGYGLMVASVDPASSAAACGVEVGHQLVSVNNRPCNTATLEDVDRLFSPEAGDMLQLVLLKNPTLWHELSGAAAGTTPQPRTPSLARITGPPGRGSPADATGMAAVSSGFVGFGGFDGNGGAAPQRNLSSWGGASVDPPGSPLANTTVDWSRLAQQSALRRDSSSQAWGAPSSPSGAAASGFCRPGEPPISVHAWQRLPNADRTAYFPVLDDRVLLALFPSSATSSFAAGAAHTGPAVATVNRAFVNPTPPPPVTAELDESLYLDAPDSLEMPRARAGTVKALAGSLGLNIRLPVAGPPPTVKQQQLAAGATESVVDGVTLAPSSPLVVPWGGLAAAAAAVAIPKPHRDDAALPGTGSTTFDPDFAVIGRTELLGAPKKPSVAGRGRRLPSRRTAGARTAVLTAKRPVSNASVSSISLEVSTI